MKIFRWISLCIVALLVVVPGVLIGPYALRVQRFHADPTAGYHAEFYLYVSPQSQRLVRQGEAITLLVQPNNSGINSDDPEVHQKDAWWMGFGRHWLANELQVALLVPAFVRPAEDWRIYTHALDRDVMTTTTRVDLARLDLQLIAMIDRARDELARRGFPSEEKVLIQGYSASGMFANRFTALHPDRVKASAAGSPGGWAIAPVSQYAGEPLPYPGGVADLEQLTGTPFDSLAFAAVPQLLVMGSLDDNDGLDFRDGWEDEPAEQIDRLFGSNPIDRWDAAERLYSGIGADARFLLVEGVGHDRKALQPFTTDFLREILGR